MNIYEARWNNALRIMAKVNSFIERGYIVYDDEGDEVGSFELKGNEIVQHISKNCVRSICVNDTDEDAGMHETIEVFNSYFKEWKAIPPDCYERIV